MCRSNLHRKPNSLAQWFSTSGLGLWGRSRDKTEGLQDGDCDDADDDNDDDDNDDCDDDDDDCDDDDDDDDDDGDNFSPMNYWIILPAKIHIGHNPDKGKSVFGLKEEFTQKLKLRHHLLSLMQMDNRVKQNSKTVLQLSCVFKLESSL